MRRGITAGRTFHLGRNSRHLKISLSSNSREALAVRLRCPQYRIDYRSKTMAWPTRKDLLQYTYNQFKGQFLGFIVGTSAASFVSTFFETRKVSNLWGLTARKTVVSGDTFRFLEWFFALVVGFIAFVVVNNLLKEKFSTFLRFLKNNNESLTAEPKRKP
jgi:hypothetical protein